VSAQSCGNSCAWIYGLLKNLTILFKLGVGGNLSSRRNEIPHADARTIPWTNEEVDKSHSLVLYRSMVRIRIIEEGIAELLEKKEIRCPTHLYTGQEAIAVGVCAALNQTDYIFGGHRSHGHYLAKGGDLRALMAELYGKSTGCAGGRGCSMHLIAPEVGLLGTVPLVAATIPIAVGSALASKLRADQRVSVSFFGDGATEEGHFHESLNLAAIYRLPVLFVCENNFYSSHMHLGERRIESDLYRFGEVSGVPGVVLDGNDVMTVYRATSEAVQRARLGEGPTLLECRTYRWRGHVGPSMDLDVGVKRKDELQDWLVKDPIRRVRSYLEDMGVAVSELDKVREEATLEFEEAVRFARLSPFPDRADLMNHVFVSAASGL
jgi:acetoin:2,6-dichlorophenolindophenol oxidoreductase subunit alpha